jgi:hypothetical protein
MLRSRRDHRELVTGLYRGFSQPFQVRANAATAVGEELAEVQDAQ